MVSQWQAEQVAAAQRCVGSGPDRQHGRLRAPGAGSSEVSTAWVVCGPSPPRVPGSCCAGTPPHGSCTVPLPSGSSPRAVSCPGAVWWEAGAGLRSLEPELLPGPSHRCCAGCPGRDGVSLLLKPSAAGLRLEPQGHGLSGLRPRDEPQGAHGTNPLSGKNSHLRSPRSEKRGRSRSGVGLSRGKSRALGPTAICRPVTWLGSRPQRLPDRRPPRTSR